MRPSRASVMRDGVYRVKRAGSQRRKQTPGLLLEHEPHSVFQGLGGQTPSTSGSCSSAWIVGSSFCSLVTIATCSAQPQVPSSLPHRTHNSLLPPATLSKEDLRAGVQPSTGGAAEAPGRLSDLSLPSRVTLNTKPFETQFPVPGYSCYLPSWSS